MTIVFSKYLSPSPYVLEVTAITFSYSNYNKITNSLCKCVAYNYCT